jgi:nucleotide-binding universal stress UspA family protein
MREGWQQGTERSNMVNTILVPVDGSAMSELAVPFAEAIARAGATKAKVILMRACAPLLGTADEYPGSQAAQAEKELEEIAHRMADGLQTEWHVISGDPAQSIVHAAEDFKAQLIVMSTHGRGGLSRAMYGSIADQVVRRTSTPVLLVPPGAKNRMHPPCKILVALDGSDLAEAALDPAIDLAQALRGRVVLVRATESPTYWTLEASGERTADPGSEAEAARKYLDDVAVRYARPGVELSGHVTDEAPEEAILGAARDHDVGTIAIATHGRSGLLRMALGSVAQQVLHRTTLPVLLVQPSARFRRAGQPVRSHGYRGVLSQAAAYGQ